MNFYDTKHCRSGVHCGWCRNQDKGRAWREGLVKRYPHLQVADFACERNLPWGYEGEVKSEHARKGVGDHLHDVIQERVKKDALSCGDCMKWIRQMNEWGPDGCEEHAEEIIDHLLSQVDKLGKLVSLAVRVLVSESAAKREARAMLDEAIRRTREAKP